MQLTYRSAQYDMNQYESIAPVVAKRQNQAIGMYRGTILPIRFLKIEQEFQSAIQLKYRGVAYIGVR